MPRRRKAVWKGAYNSEGHDKRPEGSHRIRSNGLQHGHVVLRVLCLDCIRLVIGDVRFLVKVVGMIRFGGGPLNILGGAI